MSETYSAGIVTAYGAAVRGGYTGTYEQFCAEQAQFGANAAKVAQDRAAVEAATQTFTTVTVPGAVQAVQQTGATQVQAVEAASETEQQQIALAGAAQETRVTQAGDDQVDAVEEAGATQVGNVNTAGTTQVGAVNTAGATQVQAVEDKGQEVIDSIPADYTDLTEDVADLKSALNQEIDLLQEDIGEYNYFKAANVTLVDVTGTGSYRAGCDCGILPAGAYILTFKQKAGSTTHLYVTTEVSGTYTHLGPVASKYALTLSASTRVIVRSDATALANWDYYDVKLISSDSRNILKELESLEFGKASLTLPSYDSPFYWNIEGEKAVLTSISRSRWIAYKEIPVKAGQIYKIKACQGGTHKARIWVITDDELNIVSMAEDNYTENYTDAESICIVPNSGTKLLITTNTNLQQYGELTMMSSSVRYIQQSLTDSEKAQARDNIGAANASDLFLEKRITSFTLQTEYFWNIETNVAVLTPISAANWMASSVISVQAGEVYRASGDQGGTHKTRIWAVTDDAMNVLAMAEDYYGIEDWRTETFTVPEGGTKLVLCTRSNVGTPYAYLYKLTTVKDAITDGDKILKGKTVAVIGDSISTNGNDGADANVPEMTITADDVGVELSAYLTYYDVQAGLSLGGHTYTSSEIGTEVTFTPVAGDVGKSIGLPNNYNSNTKTVWWEVMQTELGNKTIPVCWSGSSITSHEASQDSRKTAHAWHTAQIRKCGIRTPGTMTRTAPDIIIIYRGTNDFSHTPYTLLTDNYFADYDWEYPTDDAVTGGYGFKEGLCLTVKKLREAYPNAQIWLCTLNVFKRINYSHFPTNNGINSLPQYNDAIREVAGFLGCSVIEFDKDGITFENCYSGGYIADSATIPTHPTDKGHYVMGQKAIADIKAKYNELIV